MFQNPLIAKIEGDEAYRKARMAGLSNYAASLVADRAERLKLAELDKWVTENVGLD